VRSGTYTVAPVLTPAMSGMSFTPTSSSITVDRSNLTNINFLGMFSVSGRIADSAGNGIANVQMQRAVGASVVSVFTDASGNYRFNDVRSGSYTLTPVLVGKSFYPASRNITVGTLSLTNQNFVTSNQ
jgi:hypothetical protein